MKSHRPWPIKAGSRGTGASTLHTTLLVLALYWCYHFTPTAEYSFTCPLQSSRARLEWLLPHCTDRILHTSSATDTHTVIVDGRYFPTIVTVGRLFGWSQSSPRWTLTSPKLALIKPYLLNCLESQLFPVGWLVESS